MKVIGVHAIALAEKEGYGVFTLLSYRDDFDVDVMNIKICGEENLSLVQVLHTENY